MPRKRNSGFTMVELMVSLAVAGVLLGLVYAIFVSQRRGHVVQEQVAEMQQNARVAADHLTRAVQGIGNNVDQSDANPQNWQPQLLYCGPFELVFNSNFSSTQAAVSPNTAIPSLLTGGTVYTTDGRTYATGAEAHAYALKPTSGHSYDLVHKSFFDTSASQEQVVARSLSKQTPDSGGTLHDAPVFLYWGYFDTTNPSAVVLWGDTNGDGALDPAEIANLSTMPVLSGTYNGRLLDQVVTRIEIRVLAETASPDRAYAINAGYRQALVKSDAVPRNLNNCPFLGAPTSPVQVTSTQLVLGPQPNLGFTYFLNGLGQPNMRVNFQLAGPGVGLPGGPTYSHAVTTDANGVAQPGIVWPGCTWFKDNLHYGGQLIYTLTASIPAPAAHPGCGASAAAIQIEVRPGPATTVTATPGPTAALYTCMPNPASNPVNATSNTVTLQTFDHCGIEVPPPDNQLTIQTVNVLGGAPFGSLSSNVLDPAQYQYVVGGAANGQQFTVNRPTNYAGQTRDATVGTFGIQLTLLNTPSWVTSSNLPLTVMTVTPFPPVSSDWAPGTSNILTGGGFTDCSAARQDLFHLYDCYHLSVWKADLSPPNGLSYPATATLTADPSGPAGSGRQGTLTSSGNSGSSPSSAAPTQLMIGNSADGRGLYELSYRPPSVCSIGTPPPLLHPKMSLALASPPDPTTGARASSSLGNGDLNLSPCMSCVITVNPSPLTPCNGSTQLQISGCNPGKVRLMVTSSAAALGFNGTFNSAATSINAAGEWSDPLTLTGTASPYTATTTLYVGNSRVNDNLTVTVHILDPTDPLNVRTLGTCGTVTVPVSNKCTDLRITKNTSTGGAGMANGACLFSVNSFTFQVDDCQYNPNAAASQGYVTAYILYVPNPVTAPDTLQVYDIEEKKLLPNASSFGSLLAGTLSVSASSLLSGTKNNQFLEFPINEVVYVYFAYKDFNDPAGDNHIPSVLAPVQVGSQFSLASLQAQTTGTDRCQKLYSTTTPVGMCFNNAISTSGGATWQGNFEIHWGDVVIMGNGNEPTTKLVSKSSNGQLDGNGYSGTYSDRFLDFYCGKATWDDQSTGNINGIANPTPGVVDRPYLATNYGNYVRNLSYNKIRSMLQFLEYDAVKAQAIGQGVYWYAITNPGGNQAPAIYPGPTTIQRIRDELGNQSWNPPTNLTLQDVVDLGTTTSGPTRNTYHTGGLLFIDGLGTVGSPPSWSHGTLYNMGGAGTLPTHRLNGGYTQGILYIAGALNINGGQGRLLRAVKPPAMLEENYNQNAPAAGWTACGLPTRPDGSNGPDIDLTVNVHGAIYTVGQFGAGSTGGGNFGIFGAITSENGFSGSGTPEVWFDENLLNTMGAALCVTCNDPRYSKNCRLDVAEIAPVIGSWPDSITHGTTITMASCDTTANAGNTITATSDNPAIISVSPASGPIGTQFVLNGTGVAGQFTGITFTNPATGCMARIYPVLVK